MRTSRRALALMCSLSTVGALAGSSGVAFAAGPPAIEEQSVIDVGASTAVLQVRVNPRGSETALAIEFGTSQAYGSRLPAPEVRLGASEASLTSRVELTGLSAATDYHFRAVATGTGVAHGPDATFSTQVTGGELGLPDNRTWEQVSPANKHGGLIEPAKADYFSQAASDGEAVTYTANAPTEAEPKGFAAEDIQVMSRRLPRGGWSSMDIATAHSAPTSLKFNAGYEYRAFSTDLSSAVVEPLGPFTPQLGEEAPPLATERTAYLRSNFSCMETPATCYTPLLTNADATSGNAFGGDPENPIEEHFVGASPDLRSVVLSYPTGLTDVAGDKGGLYEWSAGALRLITVTPPAEGAVPMVFPFGSGAYLGAHTNQADNARGAISSDGTRIDFTAGVGQSVGLYVRDMAKGETLEIARAEPQVAPRFLAADRSGGRIFYLNGNSTADELGSGELLTCEVREVAGRLACETQTVAPQVLGIAAVTEDGSRVYFVSEAALDAGATAGEPNLYIANYTGSGWGTPKLIATLGANESQDWTAAGPDRVANMSPNGRWLAFMSDRSLTGYDNRDVRSGARDQEVFLYDADSGRLACASCNPTGARPEGTMVGNGEGNILAAGEKVWGSEQWLAGAVPSSTRVSGPLALYRPRSLTDSGRLFFDSSDALVPQDDNGTWDVYEFEPAEVGTCTTASSTYHGLDGGCIDLLTSGTSAEQSAFVDASESGADVFFLTAGPLAPGDSDTSYDVYDAHECSGTAPCELGVAPSPPCSTSEGCKAAPTPQPPIFGPPASATYAGPGNIRPPAPPPPPTPAQKLAAALRQCHRKQPKHRRACEVTARRTYARETAEKSRTSRTKVRRHR